MSEKVILNYQGLKGEAEKLDRKREDLDTLIKNVLTQVSQLDNVWQDRAASDFIRKVEEMKPTFQTFSDTLSGLSKHMKQVSDAYEKLSGDIINSQKF